MLVAGEHEWSKTFRSKTEANKFINEHHMEEASGGRGVRVVFLRVLLMLLRYWFMTAHAGRLRRFGFGSKRRWLGLGTQQPRATSKHRLSRYRI